MWGGGLATHFELLGICCLADGLWDFSLVGRRSPVIIPVTLPTSVNVIPSRSLDTQRTVLPSGAFSSAFRLHPIVRCWPKPSRIPCPPVCKEWMRLTGHLHSVRNSPTPCRLSKKMQPQFGQGSLLVSFSFHCDTWRGWQWPVFHPSARLLSTVV